jgi:hypothetical protein
LNSLDEAEHFAICLQEATGEGIVIDGIDGRDHLAGSQSRRFIWTRWRVELITTTKGIIWLWFYG